MNKLTGVRYINRNDLADVLDIENTEPFPFTEHDIRDYLKTPGVVGAVVTDKLRCVIGYMMYENLEHGSSARIIRLIVKPQCRREGIATQLVLTLRHKKVTVDINADNLVGQMFLRSQMFRAVKILSHEDIYVMERS